MHNKEYIEKICALNYTENDIVVDHSKIELDYDHPFKKYYNFNTIEKAITLYKKGKWSINLLHNWTKSYAMILSGGLNDNVVEDFTPIESYIANDILDTLDSLSFLDSTTENNYTANDYLGIIKTCDIILQSPEKWTGFYGKVCHNENVDDQFTVLVNDDDKLYTIIYDFYGEQDNHPFELVNENEHATRIIHLNTTRYTRLHHSENEYFEIRNI